MPKPKSIGPLCPVCEKTLAPRLGFSVGMIYQCGNCGYVGPLSITKKIRQTYGGTEQI